jgi:hypothetical protein
VFADLLDHLGALMGEPLECAPGPAGTGDVIQRTTTGFVAYRSDAGVATFTTGREHWSLMPRGMVYWTGWHGSAGPSAGPIAEGVDESPESTAPVETYPPIQAATMVEDPDAGQQLVIRREGTSYAVETAGPCAARQLPAGRVVFVVSAGPFAGPGSRLILLPEHAECQITQSRPL